jgi:hypothetical protein
MKMITEDLTEELFTDDPLIPQGIISTYQAIKKNRMVSQEMVSPYIQNFPMNISLSNFSELPSEKGLDIALEGFAVLFKVAAGVLLVSALGVCIFNFVRSRKAAEATTANASSGAMLHREITKLLTGIRAAGGYHDRTIKIKSSDIPTGVTRRALNLHGEITYTDWANSFYAYGHDQHFVNAIASKVATNQFPSVTEHLMTPMADYLSDLGGRVKQLALIIQDLPAALNAGRLPEMVRSIENLNIQEVRATFLGHLERVYGKELSAPRTILPANSALLLDSRVTSLKEFYDNTREDKHFVRDHYQNNLDRWRNGDVEGMLGRIPEICTQASKLGAAPSLSTGKNIVDECEKLRQKVSAQEVPEVVEDALKKILEDIRLDSVASVNLFEMVINEQRQFTIYIQDILNQTIEWGGAVAAFTKPVDPSGARKLLRDVQEATASTRKVKL